MTSEAIIDEARALVAAGESPDWKALRDRIRALGGDQRDALRRLERVGAVHRARATAAPAPATARAPRAAAPQEPRDDHRQHGRPPRRRHDARLAPRAEGHAWELRISERPDPRGDYEVRESGELPGEATSVELPLGESPIRVHLLGRDRGGRLVRRTIVSGLTRETWGERWQRRASAS